MKILALERELPGATPDQFRKYARAEAARVWDLYQQGTVREVYFRADRQDAVLVLECEDVEDAARLLSTLPFVLQGLTVHELVPLKAYPGFARLFG